MDTLEKKEVPVLKGNKVGEKPEQDKEVLKREPSGNKAVLPKDTELNTKDNPYVKSP